MINHILDLDYSKNENLENLFRTIADGNVILFLGAGIILPIFETKRLRC